MNETDNELLSPVHAHEARERDLRLSELAEHERMLFERAEELDQRRRALDIAPPSSLRDIALAARDLTMAYLASHADTSAAAQPFRDMLLGNARLFEAIAALEE